MTDKVKTKLVDRKPERGVKKSETPEETLIRLLKPYYETAHFDMLMSQLSARDQLREMRENLKIILASLGKSESDIENAEREKFALLNKITSVLNISLSHSPDNKKEQILDVTKKD